MQLGRNLLHQGRWSESEPLLRECLAIVEKATPDAWSRFNALALLGESLLGQRRFTEVEPALIAGYEGMKTRAALTPATERSRQCRASKRVVQMYDDWNRPDLAAAWKTKVGMRDLPADVFRLGTPTRP